MLLKINLILNQEEALESLTLFIDKLLAIILKEASF